MAVVMRDRYTVYGKPTIERQAAMVAFSNQVMQELGVDFKATVLDVLNKTITSLDFIRIFLGEVFFTVIAVLVLLAIILITSLLLADAEEKTFEYGILRTLGLQQDYIVILLVFQSLLFSIPGVLIGLGVCYVLFVPLGYLLSSFSGSQLDLSLDPSAIVLGSALGLVMPIVVGFA